MGAAALIAAGTAGYAVPLGAADVVRFDVDVPIAVGYNWLDITRPASEQQLYPNATDRPPGTLYIWPRGEAGLYAWSADYTVVGDADTRLLERDGSPALDAGTLVGGEGASWRGNIETHSILIYSGSRDYPATATYATDFATDGRPQYVGVRLTLDGAHHYGWFGLRFELVDYGEGAYTTPEIFAWGYETEAGVPIAAGVPGPASLGVLAIGAAGALGRRKRVG